MMRMTATVLIVAAASLMPDLDTAWVVAKTLCPGNDIATEYGQIDAFLKGSQELERRRTVTSSAVEVDLSDIPLDI